MTKKFSSLNADSTCVKPDMQVNDCYDSDL